MGYGKLITAAAEKNGLPIPLVAAVIWQESRGNHAAIRYEHGFYLRYIDGVAKELLPGHFPSPLPTEQTERRLRACSFGLMQIMGNTARLTGFRDDYLTTLLLPEVNIQRGCLLLGQWLKACGGAVNGALLKYNGGANQDYPNVIAAHIESGVYQRVL